jgi:hypothetical protein
VPVDSGQARSRDTKGDRTPLTAGVPRDPLTRNARHRGRCSRFARDARRAAAARHTGEVTEFLAGLDGVDWAALGGAYGDASELPGQLMALVDPSRRVRDDACNDLIQTVNHQSTLYECAPAAVPFLVEIVTSAGVVDDELRAVTAHLLASLLMSATIFLDGHYFRPVPGEFRTADQTVRRDLLAETWSALSSLVDELSAAIVNGPLKLRSALLATVGVIGAPVNSSTRAQLVAMERGDHPVISAQAALAGSLVDGPTITIDDLQSFAAVAPNIAADLEDDPDDDLLVVRARRLLIVLFETLEWRERMRRRSNGE